MKHSLYDLCTYLQFFTDLYHTWHTYVFETVTVATLQNF